MIQSRTLGRTSLKISSLALGTAEWGSAVPEADVDQLYSTFRAAGGNTVDTAHCYAFWLDGGEGASERSLGRCVRKFERRRDDVVVMTKGGHPAAPPKYPRPDKYLAPEVIARDLAESLARLEL